MSSLGSPRRATRLWGGPQHLHRQLQRGHREEREAGGREGRVMRSCARTLLVLLGQLFPRPHPVPAQPAPWRRKDTQQKQRPGRGDKEAAGEGRPQRRGADPSQTPADHAGGPRPRPRPRPHCPGGVTRTRSVRPRPAGPCGAARPGAERSGASRRPDSPAFWSRGQR